MYHYRKIAKTFLMFKNVEKRLMLNLFKHVHYLNFVLSSSDLFEPLPGDFFFSLMLHVKKLKHPGDDFGSYTFFQDLRRYQS